MATSVKNEIGEMSDTGDSSDYPREVDSGRTVPGVRPAVGETRFLDCARNDRVKAAVFQLVADYCGDTRGQF